MDEAAYILGLIERIERDCPERRPTSPDERRAQQIMQQEFDQLDMTSSWHSFEFNESLYANLALHFGLGTLGTLVGGLLPAVGLGLHGLSTLSYWAESTRRGLLLRRVLPFAASQNLMVTLPAKRGPELRLVFMAHADAALTGLIFSPKVVKLLSADLPDRLAFLRQPIALATRAQAALAGFDLMRLLLGPLTWPLRPIEYLLSLPSLFIFLSNLQIVLRNEVVPGANDNLSSVAALPVLARRLAPCKPDNVELLFVVTGCEEASFGGSDALTRDMEGVWDKRNTVILALDSISLGELRYLAVEGDVQRMPIPAWLDEALKATAASDPRFAGVQGFEPPVGGTDAAPFLGRGWDAVGLVCLDPDLDAPRNYHLPSDRAENLDMEQILHSIDFAEKLSWEIIARRLPPAERS